MAIDQVQPMLRGHVRHLRAARTRLADARTRIYDLMGAESDVTAKVSAALEALDREIDATQQKLSSHLREQARRE